MRRAARGASGERGAEKSEVRSDWQAEALPTKAVRAALGWTRRSVIPQRSEVNLARGAAAPAPEGTASRLGLGGRVVVI
jgi:hypothetical protein